ncbi:hypothetical protein BVRB_1g020260 [Beta vulgaris subsp. vulgaris]|nr:hypothetical protein BVRB_1g020260 [Beta vulgaris subsp. vulgaris]
MVVLSSSILTTSLAIDLAVAVVKQVLDRYERSEVKLQLPSYDNLLERLKNTSNLKLDDGHVRSETEMNSVTGRISKLKDVAYLVEEVHDDYALEMLRKKLGAGRLRRVKGKLRNLKKGGFHKQMSERINDIVSMFDKLEKEANTVGLINQLKNERSAVSSSYDITYDYQKDLYQLRKHAAAPGSKYIGKELDRKKLVQLLCNHTANAPDFFRIIAIHGMGGLGKTTLARQIYEHEEVDKYFDKKKAWVCVFKNFVVHSLLKEMVEALTSRKCKLENTGAVMKILKTELKGKKFLLVLDDVWNNDKELWDSLGHELQIIGVLPGSVILITTRSKQVVDEAGAVYVHELKGLSTDDSWALLKYQVFPSETFSLPHISSFEDVGRKIGEKCKGVPLAIKGIGNMLKSMTKYPSEWESIQRSELWNLPQDNHNHIMPSLLLSYNRLPSATVKQCFAYCGVLPKGSLLDKDKLIYLWLSQGIVHKKGSSDTLKTGEYCFQNELLLWKDGDIQLTDGCSYMSYRHVICNSGKTAVAMETSAEANAMILKLRTVSVWNGVPNFDLLKSATYLRTLIMVKIGLTEVPPAIEHLRHLRYLDLSDNEIEKLPMWIGELYQLESIITSTFVLASKGSLRDLTSLQTLPRLELRDGKGWTIDELENLQVLTGEICIKRLDCVKNKQEATRAGLGSKEKILKLHLIWDYQKRSDKNNNDENVLDGLQPHPNIKSLNVTSFNGEKFPPWMMKMVVEQGILENLTEVELCSCYKCKDLPTLGQLRSLEILKLKNLDCVEGIGKEFYRNQPNTSLQASLFPALKRLHIYNLAKLKTWEQPPQDLASTKTAFPRLETLEIKGCPVLKIVPVLKFESLRHLSFEGLGHTEPLGIIRSSHSLKELKLSKMQNIKSLPLELDLNYSTLQTLEIHDCGDLTSFPIGIHQPFVYLKKITVSKCGALSFLPGDLFHGVSSLQELVLEDCKGLKRIPTSLTHCTSLERLRVKNCPSLENLVPDVVSKLQGLLELTIVQSGKLSLVLQSIRHLQCLRQLEIGGFEDDQDGTSNHSDMTPLSSSGSLRCLILRDFAKHYFLPPQLRFLTSIRHLHIESFAELEKIPVWISKLSCLETLELRSCYKLKDLPSDQNIRRLSCLKSLRIEDCPLLKKDMKVVGA